MVIVIVEVTIVFIVLLAGVLVSVVVIVALLSRVAVLSVLILTTIMVIAGLVELVALPLLVASLAIVVLIASPIIPLVHVLGTLVFLETSHRFALVVKLIVELWVSSIVRTFVAVFKALAFNSAV